jgi:hypothetical protein
VTRIKNARTVVLELHPAIHHAANVASLVWFAIVGDYPRVTGLQEEGHSKRSKHYGIPGDIRSRAIDYDADPDHVPPAKLAHLLQELQKRLPSEVYLVQVEGEGTPSAHVHIGYQPKEVTP